jgi:putative transposase
MQTELLNRKKWTTIVELSVAVADYIENFHNTTRRHSALDMFTPTEYETELRALTRVPLYICIYM